MTQTNSIAPLGKGDAAYLTFIKEVKKRIQSAQIKAAVQVNQEMLLLYWDLGEQIIAKQAEANWGDGFLKQMSQDLRAEFPNLKGFSRRNLNDMRRWVLFWTPIWRQLVAKLEKPEFGKQFVAQIPWGHNLLILNKIKNSDEALFYVQKTLENNWSRAVLTHQIESGLYHRDGKSITNFKATLPAPQSDLAAQMLKDPYCFDFLMLREKHNEKELENALTTHLPTIGILICKSKNNTVVEYTLKDINKPIGVSEYMITKNLPNELKSSLPTIEEIEAELDRTPFRTENTNYAK